MPSGAKIEKKYENPIDNFFVHNLCEPVSHTLNKLNVTPNIITTLGFISSLLGSYFLYNFIFYYFMPLYTFAYYCDCLDGYMARKYELSSNFGDYYDHFTDITQIIIFSYVIIYRYNILEHRKLILICVIMFVLLIITQGCQEKIMDKKNNSAILSSYKNMCPDSFKKQIKYLRIFGAATTNFFFMFVAYYLWAIKMKKIKF